MSKSEAIAALLREIEHHKAEILRLEKVIEMIDSNSPITGFTIAGRERISQAQKARWAKFRADRAASSHSKKKTSS
jgi:hypothetical protein